MVVEQIRYEKIYVSQFMYDKATQAINNGIEKSFYRVNGKPYFCGMEIVIRPSWEEFSNKLSNGC